MEASPGFKKSIPWIILAGIMIWPLLIINRGFDITDTGYYLGLYRYAFLRPEMVSLTTALSTWLGGVVFALLPSGQVLALRILCVLSYALVAYWSFKMLRKHFPQWLVLISLGFSSIYATTYFYTFSYNTLSYLFLAAAVFFLYRGLERDRLSYQILAAVILGLNVFNRLPNILHLAMASVPLWYYWFCLGQRKKAFIRTLQFCAVSLAAMGGFIGIYLYFVGYGTLLQDFSFLSGSAKGKMSTGHGILGMWDFYTHGINFAWAFFGERIWKLAAGSVALLLVAVFYNWSNVFINIVSFLSVVFGLVVGMTAFADDWWFYNLNDYCAYVSLAGPVICLIGLLYYHQREPFLSVISLMALIVLVAMPFGSDFISLHYVYYFHLTMTTCLGLLFKLWIDFFQWFKALCSRRLKLSTTETPLRAAIGVNLMFWSFLGAGIQPIYQDGLRGFVHDLGFVHAVSTVRGVNYLEGMKTSPNRAAELERFMEITKPFADMKLVVLGQCPMCMAISDSEPFLNLLWIDLYAIRGDDFLNMLEQGVTERPLPMIITRSVTSSTKGLTWEDKHKKRLLSQFLKKYDYVLYSEDRYFKLYLPPDRVSQTQDNQRSSEVPN